MARIEVSHQEADGDYLPTMCMRCGKETEESLRKTFHWNPAWAHVFILLNVLAWLIAILLTRKTMRMRVPMCSEHLGHWRNRALITWLGFFFFVFMWICIAVVASQLPKTVSTIAVVACLLGSLIWLVAAVILSQNAIRTTRIDKYGIELVNVNKEFKREWELICKDAEKRRRARKKSRDDDWDDIEEESDRSHESGPR